MADRRRQPRPEERVDRIGRCAAASSLTIPLRVQFLIGQAPYYADGARELQVTLALD
jgi:hypothetical protein